MTERETFEVTPAVHRRLAVTLFNRSWELLRTGRRAHPTWSFATQQVELPISGSCQGPSHVGGRRRRMRFRGRPPS